MRLFALAILSVGALLAVPASAAPQQPPCLLVAQRIHEALLLWREGQREGWTAHRRWRYEEFWRWYNETSWARISDADVWDSSWVICYSMALRG